MSRDKIYGAIIFVVALIALIYYSLAALLWAGFMKGDTTVVHDPYGWVSDKTGVFYLLWGFIPLISAEWYTVIPIWLAATLILIICIWIGWTMLTTPPPVPLEELEELGLEDE